MTDSNTLREDKLKRFAGWQLGSDPEIQVPNLVSNHLTTGLLKYIHTTGRYASGINLFEKLRTRDIEISSLLARVLLSADEEVQAVKLLHDAVQELPMDYSLLECQAEFCKTKGRPDLALDCAKRSVIAAPSEFCTWVRLAETYVSLEQWDLALLTLNSCPMFTSQDKDAPQMPEPSRVVLPILADCMLDEIDEGPSANDIEMIHPSLRKLHAASYKGTFHKAYSLLTEITTKIGWDQLLKIRSLVFVMEEEYRSEKQTGGNQGAAINGNASTTALRRTSSPNVDGNGQKPDEETDEGDQSSKISGTTAQEVEPNGPTNGATKAAEESIEKPEHTVASEVVKAGSEDVSSWSLYIQRYSNRAANPHSSQIHRTTITHSFRTSVCASGGSTTSSWCCTKTCASTRSGGPTWPNANNNPSTTRNRPRNGRSSASWQKGCIIPPKRSRRTSHACGFASPRRP